MRFDDVRFSNRGNEPEAHLRRTRSLIDLHRSDVLVLGCGDGAELELWRRQRPRSLTGVDFFADAAWSEAGAAYARMDVRALAFADNSFDVIASTALLEHVADVDALCAEMRRVTRPGGLIFANFGPLYFMYGGAHYLGGYEHLSMDDEQFAAYIDSRGIPYERSEALHWLRNGMFSRLTYHDYLRAFAPHFEIAHLTLAVSPDALRYRREHPEAWNALCKRYAERDLLTFAMTVWMRPRAGASATRAAVRTGSNEAQEFDSGRRAA
jgi:SAM-dependent methyltransferase